MVEHSEDAGKPRYVRAAERAAARRGVGVQVILDQDLRDLHRVIPPDRLAGYEAAIREVVSTHEDSPDTGLLMHLPKDMRPENVVDAATPTGVPRGR